MTLERRYHQPRSGPPKPTCGERREAIVLNFGTVIVALTTRGTGMLGGSITEGLTAFQDDVSEIEDLESPG